MGALGGLIGWLVIGVIAGFFANKVMGGNTSLGNDLGVGTFGAFIGGIIIQLLPFLHARRRSSARWWSPSWAPAC